MIIDKKIRIILYFVSCLKSLALYITYDLILIYFIVFTLFMSFLNLPIYK